MKNVENRQWTGRRKYIIEGTKKKIAMKGEERKQWARNKKRKREEGNEGRGK